MESSRQIRKFIQESGISLKEFKRLTGMSASQVMRWCSGEDKVLRDKHVHNLEKGLCTTLESLKEKSVLNKCFFENFRGDIISIAECYAESARSFVRSSSHIVRYLELLYGKERISCILKEMSVHRAFFDELDNRINILFFVDLLEKCRRLGLSKFDLRQVAAAMFLSIEGSESQKLFKNCTNFREAYENIGGIVNLFDTNFYYDFKVTDNSVEITADPHESIVPLLEKVPVDYLFFYRRQIFGTGTLLCGLEDIHLQLDRSLSETSLTQVYQGSFPRLARARQLYLV